MSPIASDLSYEVLQRRTRQRELSTPPLHQRLGLPQLFHQGRVIRFWDAGEGEVVLDTSDDAQREMVTPFPYMTGRGRK